jgi:hypothetical protein
MRLAGSMCLKEGVERERVSPKGMVGAGPCHCHSGAEENS